MTLEPLNKLADLSNQARLMPVLFVNTLFKKLIDAGRHRELIDYPALGRAVQLAVPTPEHYLPMLYAVALQEENEPVAYFNDAPVAGSLTMTSFQIGVN